MNVGIMSVVCRFYVGFMSVYRKIILYQYTDIQKDRLKNMSDVSIFAEIVKLKQLLSSVISIEIVFRVATA